MKIKKLYQLNELQRTVIKATLTFFLLSMTFYGSIILIVAIETN